MNTSLAPRVPESNPALWQTHLSRGMEEDGWTWDWTTLGALNARDVSRGRGKKSSSRLHARIIAKSEGLWAAEGLVRAANLLAGGLGFDLEARAKVADGERLRPGDSVAEWVGPARAVLALERPFLNLASYAGGIAYATRQLVDRVNQACPKRPPRITATRKTLPGYRDIAIHAVQVGGGFSHRVSLAGGVLIKENHIVAAGGIPAALRATRAVAPHGCKIEIEVRNLDELTQAVTVKGCPADVVMLDNFTPTQVRAALKTIDKLASAASPRPLVEVSGGLTIDTIASYAINGVDILSVGSLTHSVRALDLSLLV